MWKLEGRFYIFCHQYFVISVNMGELIAAMGIIRKVFDKYAGEEGDKETLTKKELSKLLREQIGEEVSRR